MYEIHALHLLRRCESIRLSTGLAPRLEDVAPLAVPQIELVTDDREEHRVRAVQQLAVHDGVDAESGGQAGRASAVPAQSMTVFGFHEAPRTDHNGDGGSAT